MKVLGFGPVVARVESLGYALEYIELNKLTQLRLTFPDILGLRVTLDLPQKTTRGRVPLRKGTRRVLEMSSC